MNFLGKSIAIVALVVVVLSATVTVLAVAVDANGEDSTDEPRHSLILAPAIPVDDYSAPRLLFPRLMAPTLTQTLSAVHTPKLGPKAKTYRVHPGDTLGVIAPLWGVTTYHLVMVNGLSSADMIIAGQVLKKNGPIPVVTQTTTMATPVAPRSNSRIETVIAFALAQVGEPYVYAAAGPNSWDCSGLVMVAFGQIGIQLPHYTGAMIGYGTPVSHSAMQRGDIVFPEHGHVGIYLGNNQYVNAPQPGESVKVSGVYAFYAARHIA